jgi:hypothetical protein
MGALGAAAASIIVNSARGYSSAVTRAEVASEGSAALDQVWRQLIGIPVKADYGSIAPDISSLNATSIVWSGVSSITVSSGSLMLTEAGGTARVLIGNVSSLSFQAYDESNTALATSLSGTACDAVRRISIQLITTRAGVSQTFRTKVFIRAAMAGAAG